MPVTGIEMAKRISIGVWIKFELASAFVSVEPRGFDTLEGLPERLNSMSVLVRHDAIVLREEGHEVARLDELSPAEVHFGIWPTTPSGQSVAKNHDTYLAAEVSIPDWLTAVPSGTVLEPEWWSATECYFNDKGFVCDFGKTIVSTKFRREA